MHSIKTALIGIIFILYSAQINAAGFYAGERGVRSMAMGGANVAGVDDLNAAWINPAGLMNTKDMTLHIEAGVLDGNLTFHRYIPEYVGTGDDKRKVEKAQFNDITNIAPVLPTAGIGYSIAPGIDSMRVALSVYAPSGFSMKYPKWGSQRYSLIESGDIQLFTQLSGAWKINKYISIGLGLQWVLMMTDQKIASSSYMGTDFLGHPEDPDYDSIIHIKGKDIFSPSADAGVMVSPLKWLNIGLSFQLPVWINAKGSMTIAKDDMPKAPIFEDAWLDGSKISASMTMPWILRSGVEVSYFKNIKVELSFVIEGWSMLKKVSLKPEETIAFKDIEFLPYYEVGDMSLVKNFKNAYSIRLGGSYSFLNDMLILRAGSFFETSAVSPEMLNVSNPDSNKFGVALGLSFNWKNLSADISYGHIFYGWLDIHNSDVKQVSAIRPQDPDLLSTVGAGKYNQSFNNFGIQAEYSF